MTDAAARRGPWAPEFDPLDAEAPELLAAYLRFAQVPWRTRHLPVALKELVCVAASASITHLYAPGVRMHVAGALRAGAPRRHVVQALAIASRLGMRAATVALPIVAAEVVEVTEVAEVTIAGGAAAADGTDGRGADRDAVRALAPALADAWDGVLAAEGAADDGSALSARDRELIAVATHASGATLDEPGVRRHVRAALDAGATVDQLVEVIGLVSGIGLHGCLVGAAELAAHTGPAHTDTAHTGPAHTDTAHTDTAHTDTAHTDTAHTDTAHTDTVAHVEPTARARPGRGHSSATPLDSR